MPSTVIETRILAALKRHKTFPTGESVANLIHGMSEKRVLEARLVNPTINAVWDGKILEIVKRLPSKQLFDPYVAVSFLHIPAAVAHKRKILLKRIAGYRGRPSLSSLAEHVAGYPNAHNVIIRDKAANRAARLRLIALLDKMSLDEITRQRLDRKASKEVKTYIDNRKKREGVKKKKQRW